MFRRYFHPCKGLLVVWAMVLGGVLVSCASTSPRPGAPTTEPTRISFNRDIRPLLSDSCYTCHGPHEESREEDLRLDLKEGLFGHTREGFPILAPGDPSDSEIYLRIAHEDPEERMPPADSNRSLAPEDIATIKDWIEQGAAYEPHWSFIAPRKQRPPTPTDAAWGRGEIDAHILARLEREGLEPSPEADRRTLIRRLSLDLTGLPPTREEVKDFLDDWKKGGYERLVDRLLDSPHYGERMALAWMDQSRYADTNGYSIDGGRHMWLWRDWVIQAYNEDMPFDRFVVEQIAGDLLKRATDQRIVATGFNRNHMITHEGGTIPEENLTNYAVDRVKTTSEVFLGLTMGCAQCHDHKFDPISQKEYYQFFAYFNGLEDKGLDGDSGKNARPSYEAKTSIRHRDIRFIKKEIAALRRELLRPQPELEAEWEGEQRHKLASRGAGLVLHPMVPLSAKTPNLDPTRIKILDDGSIFATKNFRQAYTISSQLVDTDVAELTGIRIEFYPHADVRDGSLGYGTGEREGSFGICSVSVSAGALPSDEIDLYQLVPMDSATASYAHPLFAARDVLDPREHNGWSPLGRSNEKQHLTLVFDRPVDPKKMPYFSVMLCTINRGMDLSSPGHFRIVAISGKDDGTELPADIQSILGVAPQQRTRDESNRIRAYQSLHDPRLARTRIKLENLERRYDEMTEPYSTLVMNSAKEPRQTHVLERGDYSQPGEEVLPGTPGFLPPLPKGAPANRLTLAKWLVDPDHPLTSRVAVNRMWQLLFGTGIVATSADFGSQGEVPSHPELLDTLAVDFIESGWQVKRFMKRMVMSSAYRQQSRVNPASVAIDPENRLLSYGPRFRLQGEFIRDGALQASGLLVPWVGGSSVEPYQPAGLWREVSHYGSTPATAQVFHQIEGMNLYRRSLYTYWKRTLPPPSMMAFDAPNRELCVMQRESTNTPMQALVMLNDIQFVEASRAFAERILHELPNASDQERIHFAFEVVTSRPPKLNELRKILSAYNEQLRAFRGKPEAAIALLNVGDSPRDTLLDPAEHAALTTITNLIFNLSEALTKG